MKALAVIPARSKSTRLPGKNFLAVGGRSLVQRAVDVALEARRLGVVDQVVVSHEGWRSEFSPFETRIVLHARGEALRTPETTTLQVVQEVLSERAAPAQGGPWDLVCLLLPTSPLRTLRHVVESRLRLTEGWDAVMSVTPFRQDPRYALHVADEAAILVDHWDTWPPVVKHDGTVIWAWAERVQGAKHWYDSTRIRAYPVPAEQSVDVNDRLDLLWAETLLAERDKGD